MLPVLLLITFTIVNEWQWKLFLIYVFLLSLIKGFTRGITSGDGQCWVLNQKINSNVKVVTLLNGVMTVSSCPCKDCSQAGYILCHGFLHLTITSSLWNIASWYILPPLVRWTDIYISYNSHPRKQNSSQTYSADAAKTEPFNEWM